MAERVRRRSNVLGRTITVKDRPYKVVGVMPPRFRGQSGKTQMWLPVMMAEHFMYKGATTASFGWWIRVVGRLKPGVSEPTATAQMPGLQAQVAAEAPSFLKNASRDGKEIFQLVPFRDDQSRSRRQPIVRRRAHRGRFRAADACANTANLLLGRAVTRQPEFALRRALGASRGAMLDRLGGSRPAGISSVVAAA